jgi:hypothetical protein
METSSQLHVPVTLTRRNISPHLLGRNMAVLDTLLNLSREEKIFIPDVNGDPVFQFVCRHCTD